MVPSPVKASALALAGALAVGVLLAGCAGGTPPSTARPSGFTSLVDVAYRGRFRAGGMVIEAAGKGPQLCLGGVAASLPPQCGGPLIIGWSWGVPHSEAAGTRWGSYRVVGRYDGTSFTLTEPATVYDADSTPPDHRSRLDTPCRQPAGGWIPPHPATATFPAFEHAAQLAQHQPGFGALWIDQRDAPNHGAATVAGAVANDPMRFVLNVTTTQGTDAMERVLRTVWGGSLCVTHVRRTADELAKIQSALTDTPGMLLISSDGRTGQVELTVVRATTQLQGDLDHRFGAGAVRLTGALQPID